MVDRFPFRQYDVAHRVLVVQRLGEQLTIGHLLTLRHCRRKSSWPRYHVPVYAIIRTTSFVEKGKKLWAVVVSKELMNRSISL